MKALSRRSGFSLVELLTVIAIIAILAAIIFPVMSTVKQRANESKCMANLQQIGQAVSMFKQDNRRYPDILGSEVVVKGGSPEMFENVKDKYLFQEYVKSYQIFHCPSSKIISTKDVITGFKEPGFDPGAGIAVYAYDSYDGAVTGAGTPVGGNPPDHVLYREDGNTAEMHYRVNWAPDKSFVASLSPYPPGGAGAVTDSPATQQQDYERQLRWRNPPGDTLITWCSYHERREGTNPAGWTGKAIALFLDGSVQTFPANEMEVCKWRIRPKKS